MKAKIIFNGREMEIDITENFLLELESCLPVEKKKTGYERVKHCENYFSLSYGGKVNKFTEVGGCSDDDYYENANYYSDRTVAENNARADKLYRQLRRFAVEHRKEEIDWNNIDQIKYTIYLDLRNKKLCINNARITRIFGEISFDSEKTAQLAIDTFRDELMWYFTEYKDSL